MKKNFLDSIDVQSPCNESWDEMFGNDEVRFCSHCAKNVHNISAMTRKKAEELIKKSEGKLCVRYVKNPEGKLITAPPKLAQITRRAAIAAGVLATSLTLSTMAYSQGGIRPNRSKSTQPQKSKSKKDEIKQEFATIFGTVKDKQGGVIPGAKITLINLQRDMSISLISNSQGVYELKKIEPNIYELTVESNGFEKLVLKNIKVSGNSNLQKNLTLKVDNNIEILGVVATSTEIRIEGEDFNMLDKPIESLKLLELPKPLVNEKTKKPTKLKKNKN